MSAVSLLPRNFRSITFVGSGSQKKDLKEYAEIKGVTLKIMSPISNLQLPKLLTKFSIFTLPSLAEGSPKVLLEAMACGLVPVITNFSCAQEVIKDGTNGYITEYKVQEYANKVKILLSNRKLYQKMSQQSYLRIKKEFDLEDNKRLWDKPFNLDELQISKPIELKEVNE